MASPVEDVEMDEADDAEDPDYVEEGEDEDEKEEAEVGEAEEAEEVEKGEGTEERRAREPPSTPEIGKALAELRRGLVALKKCAGLKRNRRLFEEATRDPEPYDRLIARVDALRRRAKVLQAARKRAALPRYLRPEVRAFMREHPVGKEGAQPELPKLAKGKGVATKQTLSAYVYGYLGERCKKTGPHSYEPDAELSELARGLLGAKPESVDFGVVPRLVTSALIPGVKPLDEDVASYGDVLAYFATLKKPRVRSKKAKEAKDGGDEEMDE